MQRRTRGFWLILVGLVFTPLAGCDALEGLLDFFGRGVTIVIENDTSFTAVPDIRRSESTNLIGDLFDQSEEIRNFGDDGRVRPNTTVSVRVSCDDDLGSLIFRSVQFREGNSFAVGAAALSERLRKGDDFECGDTIHLRLSGSIFTFDADVEVKPAPRLRPADSDRDEEDFADWLDRWFD